MQDLGCFDEVFVGGGARPDLIGIQDRDVEGSVDTGKISLFDSEQGVGPVDGGAGGERFFQQREGFVGASEELSCRGAAAAPNLGSIGAGPDRAGECLEAKFGRDRGAGRAHNEGAVMEGHQRVLDAGPGEELGIRFGGSAYVGAAQPQAFCLAA